MIKSITKKQDCYLLLILLGLSFLHFLFATRTGSFFSVDDFAVLAYFKTHSLLESIPDLVINGDMFGFRKIFGFLTFGTIFKIVGINSTVFDIFMFIIHTLNLVLLFLIVKKLTKLSFTAFFVSLLFNKNYLFYYSNIHEVMLSFFCFLTIYLFLTYPKKFYLSLITYILALFTKETAVTLPLIIFVISYFESKVNKKYIKYFVSVSILFGLYYLYFFIQDKVKNSNYSYETSLNPSDIYKGFVYFLGYPVLIAMLALPFLFRQYRLLIFFSAILITIVPASTLVHRRELYYLYLPFGYLMIYLSLLLPKLNVKTIFLYLLLLIVFGGRQVFPQIAWQIFPNWQKVSLENVTNKINLSLKNDPSTKIVNLEGVNVERDARLMLESGTTDLFIIDKNLASKYNFKYDRGLNIVEIDEK